MFSQFSRKIEKKSYLGPGFDTFLTCIFDFAKVNQNACDKRHKRDGGDDGACVDLNLHAAT